MRFFPGNLLRKSKAHEHSKVGFVELFFDLVFVFAVTQLAHSLLEHFSLAGLAQTAFLTMAVWWAWIYTTWVTNWLDPQTTAVRLMLFVLMFAGLLLSIAIPHAFEESAVLFASAYTFMQVGRSLFMCWAMKLNHAANFRLFLRISSWFGVSAIFWFWGAFSEPNQRYLLWGLALLIESFSAATGFWTPGLGRSKSTDWNISGEHMAERCGLFIIIALGESLLVTGSTFANGPHHPWFVAAFITSFTGTVAMWWIYFNVGADHAAERIAHSDDPGKIARLAYTYLHIFIVAGIIVTAVSDEFVLAHPGGHTDGPTAFTVVLGPLLFLLGNLFFKRAVFQKWALSHLTGSALLLLVLPLFILISPTELSAIVVAILVMVGMWEHFAVKR